MPRLARFIPRLLSASSPTRCAAKPPLLTLALPLRSKPSTLSSLSLFHSTSFSAVTSLRTRSCFPTTIYSRSPLLLPTTEPHAATTLGSVSSVRPITYGREYQPSQRKRKRKHGFLSRAKGGRLGRKMLERRRAKGKRFLSH